MQLASMDIITVLFGTLTAFVIINAIVNFILYMTQPTGLYKLLVGYWSSVLVFFLIQSVFQEGEFQVAMAYAFAFVPVSILALVAFSSVSAKFPLKEYVLVYFFALLCSVGAFLAGGHFTAIALPLSLATAAPILHSSYLILFQYKKSSTKLQKFLGAFFLLLGVHCFNFAFFRMGEGNQLWGWLVTYAGFDVLGILMPSIALERAKLDESNRLEIMVKKRTEGLKTLNDELRESVRKSDTLLKVVLHDMSKPLKALSRETRSERSIRAIEELIENVKDLYGEEGLEGQSKIMLDETEIIECLEQARFLVRDSAKKKNIKIVVMEELSSKAFIIANKTTLTHSVFSNLLSQGIFLSHDGNEVNVRLSDKSGAVDITLEGLPSATESMALERPEMSILRSFIKDCGGTITIDYGRSSEKGAKLKLSFYQVL